MDDTGRQVGGRRGDLPRRTPRKPPQWPVGVDHHDLTPEGADGFEGGWFGKPAPLDDRPRSSYRQHGQAAPQRNGHVNGQVNGHANGRVNGHGPLGNAFPNSPLNSSGHMRPVQRPQPPPMSPTQQIMWPEFDMERFRNGQTDPGPFGRVPFEPRPPVAEPGPTRATPPPRDDLYDRLYENEPDDEDDRPLSAFATITEKKKRKRKLPFWLELPILVVVALLFTFVIQTFVARVYVIPSGSMELTLNGNNGTGDRILVDKVVFDFHSPRPGDVIVFKGPPGWDQTEFFPDSTTNPVVRWLRGLAADVGVAKPDEYDLVKRVVAVGGQTVSCCDAQNRTMVDGKALNEPYIYWQPGRPGPAQQLRFGPITIPKGYLWVEGDNRSNSDDSRYQNGGGIHGVVPVTDVIGKARTIIWPPSRWRGVGDHDPQAIADTRLPWPDQLTNTGVGALATLPSLWLGRRRLLAGRERGRRAVRGGRQALWRGAVGVVRRRSGSRGG